MKFGLVFYGNLFDQIPLSKYVSNVRRTTEIVSQAWKYNDVFKTAHLSGSRVGDIMHLFDSTHIFSGPSTTFKRSREEMADAFKILEFEKLQYCMMVRIDVYIEELSRANPYVVSVVHNIYDQPWDGIILGKVASLKSCSLHTRVTGSPQYQLQACCKFLNCQEFHRYTVRWTRPPGEALQGTNPPQSPVQVFTRKSKTNRRYDMLSERGILNTTAVLVTGGVRSLMYPEIALRMKARVLKPLHADLFLYLDQNQVETTTDEEKHTCAHRSEVPLELRHINMTSIVDLLQPKLYGSFDDCRAFGNVPLRMGEAADAFFLEDEQNPEERWKSAGSVLRPVNCSSSKYRSDFAQFIWAEKGFHLVKLFETQRAQKYDWILKMRPDVVFTIPVKMPGFTFANSRTVFGYPFKHHLLLSWWLMIPRVVAETYFKVATAMRHCDLLTFGLDRAKIPTQCDGLQRNEIECFVARWLQSNSIRTDRVFGRHFETSLVRIINGKRSVVTSQQMNLQQHGEVVR